MRRAFPLILISVIWFGIGWFSHELAPSTSLVAHLPPEQLRVLKAQQILQNRQLLLDRSTTEATIPAAFAEAAIEGMLVWSQDPHAELYGPLATERYRQSFDNDFGVTDLQFDEIDGQKIVTRISSGSPAEAAGIRAGDVLLGIDGVRFDTFVGAPEVALLLQGPVNTDYTLTFQRDDAIITRTIQRRARTYLTHRLLQNQFGYLKVHYFSPDNTEQLLKIALDEFTDHKVNALIMDLRGNSGGYPVAAGRLVGYFVQPGTPFYTVVLRDGSQHQIEVEGNGDLAEMPIAVLIDGDTWSAGEIVAAALAQRPRTELFGVATAGKGIVQETTALDDEYMLHFTVAKWLTPTGEWIQHKGFEPDVQIEDDPATTEDEVLDAAITYLESTQAQIEVK